MPDNDPSQIKLSQWWHNQYNRAWHTLETIQRLTSLGVHVHFFEIETLRGDRGTWCEIFDGDESYEAFSPNFLDAFWHAKDNFDMSRKVCPVDPDDRFESVERHEKMKGSGCLHGEAAISPEAK